jgi:RNA polymerase sigma factor (sigma-70 family)
MLRTQSDARLVDLVRAGHTSAFEAIVHRYRKPLLGYCSRLLPASRAEDAVQQTFLKAYQSMMSGDAELNLRPWLYRIAHNASLNLLRQNGWSHDQLDENMDGVQRPDQALELRERLGATVAAVKALPERQRNAVLLREIDGLSYEEIALALGVGDGAVRQLLHRARATLRAGMTAATPLGLVERLAAAMAGTGADPSARVAEMAAGISLGTGAVKLGAAVLATGVIATGAVAVPLSHHSRHDTSVGVAAAEASAPASSATSNPAPTTQVDDRSGRGSGSPSHRGSSHHQRHHGRAGGDGSNSGNGPSAQHRSPLRSGRGGFEDGGSQPQQQRHDGSSGSGDDHHSGSTQEFGAGGLPGGSGDGSSGSGSGDTGGGGDTLSTDGGGDHSGSDGGGSNDGSTTPTTTAPTGTTGPTSPVTDDSGKDGGGSGSGTSGGN